MTVRKPWGHYKDLANGESTFGYDWKIKCIVVYPLQKLSRQSHQLRDEFWVVIGGEGRAFLGDLEQDVRYLNPGDWLFISADQIHRLYNPSDVENLILIEVQAGQKCREEDIVRFADEYNRS